MIKMPDHETQIAHRKPTKLSQLMVLTQHVGKAFLQMKKPRQLHSFGLKITLA